MRTKNGISVIQVTTEEFALRILSNPHSIHTFTMALDDTNNTPWPWYGVVCGRPIEAWQVFINRLTGVGGAADTFDLPSFNEYVEIEYNEEQDDECEKEMMDGLERFYIKYAPHDINNMSWFVKNI